MQTEQNKSTKESEQLTHASNKMQEVISLQLLRIMKSNMSDYS